MRGVAAIAQVGGAALVAASPLEAAAWDVAREVYGQAPASPAVRAAAVALLLLGALLVGWRWLRRERALGRGAPLTAASDIDRAWLERRVLALSPELAGAAFDRRVGGAEVAALLARLCGETKLASRVAAGARGWNNLELWRLVEPDELSGYERELVDRLFGASNSSSVDRVRERYRAAGFAPAALLREPLQAAADAALGVRAARRWPYALLLGAAALALALTIAAAPSSLAPLLLALLAGALGPLWAIRVASPRYHRDPSARPSWAHPCVAPAAASVAALALIAAAWPPLPALAPFALAAWGLAGAALVARAAATRESAAGVSLRRDLLSARRFFAAELERPEPRLSDDWLPHLIALELTRELERWYQAFGRIETAARPQRLAPTEAPAAAARATSLVTHAPLEAASPWTGGAGGLGGVGPSAPWIAATAGLHVAPARPGRALGLGPQRVLAPSLQG